MGIMAENRTEYYDFNWGFATLGTLHYNGKYYFEALLCTQSFVQQKILFWNRTIFRIFNSKLKNIQVANFGKQQFEQRKSITSVS